MSQVLAYLSLLAFWYLTSKNKLFVIIHYHCVKVNRFCDTFKQQVSLSHDTPVLPWAHAVLTTPRGTSLTGLVSLSATTTYHMRRTISGVPQEQQCLGTLYPCWSEILIFGLPCLLKGSCSHWPLLRGSHLQAMWAFCFDQLTTWVRHRVANKPPVWKKYQFQADL